MGMGTTLTAALLKEGRLTVAHVGDSRAYLLHDGALTQLTQDHSWVGEMVRRGELTPAQAAVHPHRSVITRALGTDGGAEPDMMEIPVMEGDRLLLCSDGLTGMVSDAEIEALLKRSEDPQVTAELLVQAALAEGGEDNVTVVVVDILPERSSLCEDAVGGGSGEQEALPADEVLLGPQDRGSPSTARVHLGIRPGAGIRRLGARVGPLRRAVGVSPVGDQAAGEDKAESGAVGSRARRWMRRRSVTAGIAVLAFLVVLVVAFFIFNSTVYYVGVADGAVALYHGLPGFSSVIERGNVSYDSLAPHLRQRIDAHDLVSKEEGQLFLRMLSTQP